MTDLITLPMTVEELTPDWLGWAIASANPGVEISHAEVEDVSWGSATKVFMTARYAARPADGPPEKLCVKGGFDERVREAMQGMTDRANEFEARFFAELAPRLQAPMPRCWFAGASDGHGVMVFDDLRDQGAIFGDPTEPWSPDRVAAGLEYFARLHASTWNRQFEDVEWLTVGASAARQAVQILFSAAHWESHFYSPEAVILPPGVADRERNLRGYEALWASDDRDTHCLSHGDAHMANTYVDASGQALMLDWATACLAPWSYDVTYFLTGALTVEDRRSRERDLLRHYLEALAANGGPELGRDQAWTDYQRHHMHGLIWACAPATMQPLDNIAAMAERFITAVEDHDTLRALGV